jgi:hypothetical protein
MGVCEPDKLLVSFALMAVMYKVPMSYFVFVPRMLLSPHDLCLVFGTIMQVVDNRTTAQLRFPPFVHNTCYIHQATKGLEGHFQVPEDRGIANQHQP